MSDRTKTQRRIFNYMVAEREAEVPAQAESKYLKYKDAYEKYRTSEKGKKAAARYYSSEQGRATAKRWRERKKAEKEAAVHAEAQTEPTPIKEEKKPARRVGRPRKKAA